MSFKAALIGMGLYSVLYACIDLYRTYSVVYPV